MAEKFHVHVVSHTHWDREWYLPFQQYWHRLVDMIDNLLKLLEEKPSFNYFVLDGQTVVLEDYLEIRPENQKRLKREIRRKRLFIGPWYILPDEFLVSGESLVRNLLRGHQIAGAFGHIMKIGYLPDSFGHINQLPQVLNGFGLDNVLFTRGMGNEFDLLGTEFYWETPDGSRVLAINQYEGYCHGGLWGFKGFWSMRQMGKPSVELAVQRLQKTLKTAKTHSHTTEVLFNNGCDHLYAQPEIPELIDGVNQVLPNVRVEHSNFEAYTTALKKSVKNLPVYRGEFRGGKNQYLLSGVLSTRMYLKQMNDKIQALFENVVEPFAVLADNFFGLAYPAAFLAQAWKLILLNHPHDSICGCSVDSVHREMETRFDQALEIGEWLLFDLAGRMAESFAAEESDRARVLLIANTLPWRRKAVIRRIFRLDPEFDRKSLKVTAEDGTEIPVIELWRKRVKQYDPFFLPRIRSGEEQARRTRQILRSFPNIAADPKEENVMNLVALEMAVDLPAMSVNKFVLKAAEDSPEVLRGMAAENCLENAFVRVTVYPNGTFDLFHKPTQQAWSGLNLLEDQEDAGDEYDYSPCENPDIRFSDHADGKLEIIENTPLRSTIQVTYDFLLPASICEDRKSRCKEQVPVPVRTTIGIERDSDVVNIQTHIENRAEDHRLRVRFPARIESAEVVVDVHFDVIRRSVHLPDGKDWMQKPVSTQNQRNFVAVEDGTRGLAVFNMGLPEYEAIEGDRGLTVALTLFRSVDWLSRDKLGTRSAKAGPALFTPEAQCKRQMTFSYAVKPYAGTWQTANLLHHALNYKTDPVVWLSEGGKNADGVLPVKEFVTIESTVIQFSALKKQEKGNHIILRLYNTKNESVTIPVWFHKCVKTVYRSTLSEKREEELALTAQNVLKWTFKPKQIVTFELEL